jgi:hypothetical protein
MSKAKRPYLRKIVKQYPSKLESYARKFRKSCMDTNKACLLESEHFLIHFEWEDRTLELIGQISETVFCVRDINSNEFFECSMHFVQNGLGLFYRDIHTGQLQNGYADSKLRNKQKNPLKRVI